MIYVRQVEVGSHARSASSGLLIHSSIPIPVLGHRLNMSLAAIAAAAQGVLGLNVHDFPKTSFSCKDKNAGEYYADPELSCQVYHICAVGQFNRLTKMSFACPNGTLFSQSSRICNSEDKVYCPLAERYYDNVQGTIDTQGDYKSVFQVKALFPLEPRRPAAARRRPAPQDDDDDYEDEPSSTATPRRPQNPRRPPARPSTTTAAPAIRQRPPQRQFTPQIPSSQQFPQQSPASPEQRPPAGNFFPPRQAATANSRNPPPAAIAPQLTGVTQSPIQYAAPDRAASPGAPFIPPAPTSQTQAPNRLVVTRPNLRRPAPVQGGTVPATTSTPAPRTTSTTLDPNAEYEYYDYEEPADGQQNANNQ
ncbi:uncharacterized protein LOC108864911 [Galendromus occidentalis]|uniref:Uncharacterized protein LOC108864911 n=1 Tax=Galendromus occidentalis TaxID=34638 RepID=A0AAJ7L8A6_9ACAR|nr:uncharacterized protein LOC108864911 [Galendromus occidentalis]